MIGVPQSVCFGPIIVPRVHLWTSCHTENEHIDYANNSQALCCLPSQALELQSLNRDLDKVWEWCDLLGDKIQSDYD